MAEDALDDVEEVPAGGIADACVALSQEAEVIHIHVGVAEEGGFGGGGEACA